MTFVPKVCPKACLSLSERSDKLVSLSVVIMVENAICLTINWLRLMPQDCVICDQRKIILKSGHSQGGFPALL